MTLRNIHSSNFTLKLNSALTLFLLSCISFFLPIGDLITKLITYASFAFLFCFQSRGFRILNYTGSLPFLFFICSVIFSIIPAKIYWEQSISASIVAIFPFLIYSLYFILTNLNCKKDKLNKILIYIGKVYVILYLLKTIFPILPIGTIVEDEIRGNRLFIPGDFFGFFLYFSLLNNFVKGQNRKSKIIWLIMSVLVIILPLTRQRILLAFILGGILIFKEAPRKYKPYIVSIFIIVGVTATGSIVTSNLSQMTTEQLDSDNPYDHIREIGIVYYFTEFPHKGINEFIGNGVPSYGRSEYGNDSKQFAEDTKIFLVDIGFAGIYNYFGYIGLFSYCWMILYFVLTKGDKKYDWCKYMMIFILGSSVLSGVPLFPSRFIFIPICAYLITPPKILQHGSKHNSDKLQYTQAS